MKTRFAFAGFRHAHAFDLLAGVRELPDAVIVACSENDAATRDELAADAQVEITHSDFAKMLRETDCDAVVIGDFYAQRGAIALAALRAGRHVLSDKPLCTSLAELDEIERLASEHHLQVVLQLDCRDSAAFRTLREIVCAGEIGEVCTVRIAGQHPLRATTRPRWYFEPGKHGGTINDIAIHAFDFVPWLTGSGWRSIAAARAWDARPRELPGFRGCAQFLAVLNNEAGVLGDFSYLAPEALGYKLPHYWHVEIHGTGGMAEAHLFAENVTVITHASTAPETRRADDARPRGYLTDFVNLIRGEPALAELDSAQCFRASRLALEAQRLADG